MAVGLQDAQQHVQADLSAAHIKVEEHQRSLEASRQRERELAEEAGKLRRAVQVRGDVETVSVDLDLDCKSMFVIYRQPVVRLL